MELSPVGGLAGGQEGGHLETTKTMKQQECSKRE